MKQENRCEYQVERKCCSETYCDDKMKMVDGNYCSRVVLTDKTFMVRVDMGERLS